MADIVIVDRDDRPIGIKARADVSRDGDIYRVAALWLTNSQNDIFLAQRALVKDHNPGKWGPAVAGTVEADETYEQNIYKEAGEEIGLTGIEFKLGPKVYVESSRKYFCQWYTLTLDRPAADFKRQIEEVETFRWFTAGELKSNFADHPDNFVPTFNLMAKLFKLKT